MLDNVRRHPSKSLPLRKALQRNADLCLACSYPDTDLDVLIAVVMRYLHEKVFSQVLYGAVPGFVDFVSTIEAAMQQSVQPARGELLSFSKASA